MTTRFTLTAVFESVENGWTQARIVELPAVITAAPTQVEAEELLADALIEYLRSLGPESSTETSSSAQQLPLEVVIGASSR